MKLQYLKNVVTLELDREKCLGCGMCLEVCPHNVFTIAQGKALTNNRDSCMECGACAKNCPLSAIIVRPGVGCAGAIILGKLKGSGECSCG